MKLETRKRFKITLRRSLVTLAELMVTFMGVVQGVNWALNLMKFWIWVSLALGLFCFAIIVAAMMAVPEDKREEVKKKFQSKFAREYIPNWVFSVMDLGCVGILATNSKYVLASVWLTSLLIQYSIRNYFLIPEEAVQQVETHNSGRMLRPEPVTTVGRMKRFFRLS